MDCEKFDLLVMDALYDELDELTLAAARRHTESCTRCQSAWSGLKATKKVGILQLVDPPSGLSDRILRLAEEAQRNVPWPRRVGRAVSWAASYAMRPQMAMAALLLLAVGISLSFLRTKPNAAASAQVSVTERGVPERGTDEFGITADRVTAVAAPADLRPGGGPHRSPTLEVARAGEPPAAEGDREAPAASEAPPPAFGTDEPMGKLAARPKAQMFASNDDKSAGPGSDFAVAPSAAPRKKAAAAGAAGGGLYAARDEPMAAPPAATAAAGSNAQTESSSNGAAPSDLFGSAMALYRAGRYAEAVAQFDRAAAAGGANAALASLYAARSAQASSGCATAVDRFETTAARFPGTGVAADALWAAATCHRSLGNVAQARTDYGAARNFPAYRERADQALVALGGAPAASKADSRAAASKPAAAAPPPAAPPQNSDPSR